jgi:hypothetical protein
MATITKLHKKIEVVKWTIECEIVWENIKNQYIQVSIMIIPNWKLKFHVHSDTSQLAIGVILAQNPINKFDQLIIIHLDY